MNSAVDSPFPQGGVEAAGRLGAVGLSNNPSVPLPSLHESAIIPYAIVGEA